VCMRPCIVAHSFRLDHFDHCLGLPRLTRTPLTHAGSPCTHCTCHCGQPNCSFAQEEGAATTS
jgi:hypothetical protein